MEQAERGTESYLADARDRWVSLTDITRDTGLDRDETGYVWHVVLPTLVDAGLLRRRWHASRGAFMFRATPALVAGVAALQWIHEPLDLTTLSVGDEISQG